MEAKGAKDHPIREGADLLCRQRKGKAGNPVPPEPVSVSSRKVGSYEERRDRGDLRSRPMRGVNGTGSHDSRPP